jgi:hypothetical protein
MLFSATSKRNIAAREAKNQSDIPAGAWPVGQRSKEEFATEAWVHQKNQKSLK